MPSRGSPAAAGTDGGRDTGPGSQLWELVAPGLPVELTSFVGRGRELAELDGLVAGRRLVTVTGVGGGGKTRLAAQIAARRVGDHPDGVWWVALGCVSDPDVVASTVAEVLRVLVEPGGDALAGLCGQLRERRLLLCLDTCEHLLDEVAGLVDVLLRACPGVSVLATSREPLRVAGEVVWRVPPLSVEESVGLFADRASLAAPTFDAPSHTEEVTAICRRLDGIPLAVELAAAWVRVLSPGQIAAALDDSFRLLTGGPRGALPRHETLAASMAWSHDQLGEVDRVMFRRLAVFTGPFSLEAVRDVCRDEARVADDAVTVLGRLVDKSLVQVVEAAASVGYRLLDPVRHYAQELLDTAGEVELGRDLHLDHFLALAERVEPELDRDQDRWRHELDPHHINIGAALRWGLRPADPTGARGRRLAAAMARHWFVRSQAHDGLRWLRRAVERDPADRSRVAGRLLAGTAMLGVISGQPDLVGDAAARGLEIATENADDASRARCLVMAGWRAWVFLDFDRCEDLTVAGAELADAVGEPFARDWGHVLAGYQFSVQERLDEAVALARPAVASSISRGDRFVASFGRGVELFPTFCRGEVRGAVAIGRDMVTLAAPLGDYFAVGTHTTNLAFVLGLSGEIDAARRILAPIARAVDEAPGADVFGLTVTLGLLELWAGDLEDAAHRLRAGTGAVSPAAENWMSLRCLLGSAGALRRLGRVEEAAPHVERAVALTARIDTPVFVAEVLDEQAFLLADSDTERSLQLHHEALAVRRANGLRTFWADSLDALAGHASRAGRQAHAARLLAASGVARETIGYPRHPVDLPGHNTAVAELRAALGERFDAEWAAGTGMSLDDAVEAATRGRGRRARPASGWGSLTPTETQVVRLVATGLSNPEIGTRLFISRTTVKTHLAHVYRKLGVANRTELAATARQLDDPPA